MPQNSPQLLRIERIGITSLGGLLLLNAAFALLELL